MTTSSVNMLGLFDFVPRRQSLLQLYVKSCRYPSLTPATSSLATA